MDFVKLLRSAEELVFIIGSWLIFIPKTVGRVGVSAEWTHSYVREQLAIDKPENRYLGYLSPILFWVGTGILPYLAVLHWYGSRHLGETERKGTVYALTQEHRLWLAILLFIGFPLGFSLVHNLFKRRPIDRPNLEPMFLTQCYAIGLGTLSLTPLFVRGLKNVASEAPGFVTRYAGWIAVLGAIWFLQTEYRILRVALQKGKLATALWTLVYVSLSSLLTLAIVLTAMFAIVELYINVG